MKFQSLDEIIKLCLHHVSHNNPTIRKLYLDILAKLPLSVISHALCITSAIEDNEYTSNKVSTLSYHCSVNVLCVFVIKNILVYGSINIVCYTV